MPSNINFNLLLLTFLLSIILVPTTATTIVTGPIIGKVTKTTARVLLEFDTEVPVTVILTDSRGNEFRAQRNTKTFIPVPFSFENLQPNTTYTVTLSDKSIPMMESYFRTLSGASGELTFAVVSCDERSIQASKARQPPEDDLWIDLLTKVQNNYIQYILHIGDQVYIDREPGTPSLWEDCMSIINQTPRDQWMTKKQEILEIIRNEYRMTWNYPTVKAVLAKIPALMIFDDHEIRNDWGYRDQEKDVNSADYFYGTIARQVYYEYQRQLREDINFDDLSTIHEEYYYEVLNDIGFFFVDYRGIRTWHKDYSQVGDTKLGKTQADLIQQLLDPINGKFASMTNFFLVSPLAVIEPGHEGYPGQTVTNPESWGFRNSKDQAELFDILRIWKDAKQGREVTILGGDTHVGGYTDIMYNGKFAFLEFVSSSIASTAPSEEVYLGFDITDEIRALASPWTFRHHEWTMKHNYGIVIASNQDDHPTVECYLIEGNYIMRTSYFIRYFWKDALFGILIIIIISRIF